MEIKLDCRYYIGDKPCKYKRLCHNCPFYSTVGTRILIIKLGAIGDALRTTPILQALARQYRVHYITWITDSASFPVLSRDPRIDRLIDIGSPEILTVFPQEFDLLLSLDKAPSATAVAMLVKAHTRRGYAMSPWGTMDVFNDAAEYSRMLGLDDELKFRRNIKTYQETIYEIAELPFQRDPYGYQLDPADRDRAEEILLGSNCRGTGPRVGFNTGCGPVFATKKWPDEHFIRLGESLYSQLDSQIYLLGGESERSSNRAIESALDGIAADTGVHSINVFAGILAGLDLVVTGDTMALHLALAVKTKVVALFGPTCHQEIDLYGLGEKLVATTECTPCYKCSCTRDVSCMSELTPERVSRVISGMLGGDPTA
ncbi:glycosyltransferase family 9 protein [bacterium]|nr:glycosyltransferase family 9 protein [candidate division CSSED10-310 bacterium]